MMKYSFKSTIGFRIQNKEGGALTKQITLMEFVMIANFRL